VFYAAVDVNLEVPVDGALARLERLELRDERRGEEALADEQWDDDVATVPLEQRDVSEVPVDVDAPPCLALADDDALSGSEVVCRVVVALEDEVERAGVNVVGRRYDRVLAP
jgi:hypothetical protein